MNMIFNMIFRQLVRRGVNAGISTAIRAGQGRTAAPDEEGRTAQGDGRSGGTAAPNTAALTPEQIRQEKQAKQAAKRAKQAIRAGRLMK